jgi:hypothetical protein
LTTPIAPPTNVKQICSFVGMINHYKNMIPHRSHLLTPIIELTKTNTKFHWLPSCQQSFDKVKQLLAKCVSLVYPNFSLPFDVYTNASKFQLGAVISQQTKPIAFYSCKLMDAQQRYTIIELELLSIVKTLREYRTILLGRLINMYTDHKNLSFDNFTSDRVRRWRLIIEEYGPCIVYLPGSNNIIADALSCLPTSNTTSQNNTSSSIEHIFMSDEFFTLAFETIATAQQQDTCLQNKLLTNASYEQHIIRQNAIIYHDNKMVIPQSLQSHILDWYHTFLLHPGTT